MDFKISKGTAKFNADEEVRSLFIEKIFEIESGEKSRNSHIT